MMLSGESDRSGVTERASQALDHAVTAASLVGQEINLHISEGRELDGNAYEAERALRWAAALLRRGVFDTRERER